MTTRRAARGANGACRGAPERQWRRPSDRRARVIGTEGLEPLTAQRAAPHNRCAERGIAPTRGCEISARPSSPQRKRPRCMTPPSPGVRYLRPEIVACRVLDRRPADARCVLPQAQPVAPQVAGYRVFKLNDRLGDSGRCRTGWTDEIEAHRQRPDLSVVGWTEALPLRRICPWRAARRATVRS